MRFVCGTPQASYLEISTANTGLLMGVGNTFATLPTFLSPIAVVAILDRTASWAHVFVFLALCNTVALFGYHCLVDTRSLDAPTPRGEKGKLSEKLKAN